jgi:hypothetical protein
LQQLQEFGLQTQVEFRDFVEKERAAMGHLHASRFRSVGAGESPFFVSEELAFEQGTRDCRTVDLHKGTAAPRGKPMDHAGNNVFAGAAFALDQDGNVGARNFVHAVTQRLHDLRATENHSLGRKLPE